MRNFRATEGHDFAKFRQSKTLRQHEDHRAEIVASINGVANECEQPIRFEHLASVTEATFSAMKSAR